MKNFNVRIKLRLPYISEGLAGLFVLRALLLVGVELLGLEIDVVEVK